jgi:chemotaxis protein methyltransferase CheR
VNVSLSHPGLTLPGRSASIASDSLFMPTAFDLGHLSVPEGVPVLLRDLIHDRTGIYFELSRADMMLDKLRDRVTATGCSSYLDYYYILKYDEKGTNEWLRVMDAFSVQETYFWRESSQIEALVGRVIPQWFAKNSSPFRIWSAACASGEEPYSIAIAIQEAGLSHLPIEIHASDASEIALTKARTGIYRERSFRTLAPELWQKYFKPVPEGWQLDPNILRRVHFSRANLVAPNEVTPLARASVIFCRNVFIYFSPDAIRRAVEMFAAHMLPPGYLFVGSSESLLKITQHFELQEIDDAFVYIRRTPGALNSA